MVLEELDGAFGSLMCVPLILRERILGVFGMASPRPKGFQERERRLLAAIASQMDTAIFESLEQRRLRMVLGRSVDPRVMERLLTASDVGFLKGERQVLTVLYADLRGSTSMAEVVAPEVLVDYMNAFLGTMSDVILKHEGTLDKFIGDEVMALFGAPAPQEDHALRSVRVALAMQNAHAALLARRERQGLPGCPMGVGIATGELIVGEMGSAQRLHRDRKRRQPRSAHLRRRRGRADPREPRHPRAGRRRRRGRARPRPELQGHLRRHDRLLGHGDPAGGIAPVFRSRRRRSRGTAMSRSTSCPGPSTGWTSRSK